MTAFPTEELNAIANAIADDVSLPASMSIDECAAAIRQGIAAYSELQSSLASERSAREAAERALEEKKCTGCGSLLPDICVPCTRLVLQLAVHDDQTADEKRLQFQPDEFKGVTIQPRESAKEGT